MNGIKYIDIVKYLVLFYILILVKIIIMYFWYKRVKYD